MVNVVGVDLGGTKVAAALLDGRGRQRGAVARRPSSARQGPQHVLDAVAAVVREAAGGVALDAVGVGSAGVVDAQRGVIVSSTDSFTGWPGTDVRGGLQDRLGVDVSVVNDVDAYALGEAHSGAARDLSSFVMAAVGTGVGGAIVIDGQLRRGQHHVAGEIAHIPVPGADRLRCACGRTGHLEAIAAGPAIERLYRSATGRAVSGADIALRAGEGEDAAVEVLRQSATALGRALAGVVTTFDLDGILVGGSVSNAGAVWWTALEATLRHECIEPMQQIPLRPTEHGDFAPILGAACATGLISQEK